MRTPVYGSRSFRHGADEPFDVRVWLRKLCRVLWVCRASAASAAVGCVFAGLGQVHDLYLDIEGVAAPHPLQNPYADLWPPLREGLLLGLLVTAFWALPVHAVARLAVSSPAWLGSPYQPLMYRDLDGAAGRFDGLAKAIPRALGLLCYAAAIAAAVYAWIDLPIETGTALADRVFNRIACDVAGLLLFAALFAVYIFYRRRIYFRIVNGNKAKPAPRIGASDEDGAIGRGFDLFVSAAILLGLLFILLYPPALDDFPRLRLVPLLLGAWTPILGLLAQASYRAQLPITLLTFLAALALLYFNGDNHDSDLIAAAPPPRPGFPEAVKRWKALNCDGDDCPSPILALVTGGASRSAFFADSVLGLMTDASCEKPGAAPGACGGQPLFARRLFALSTVSGGSVGAAVFARALMDGRDKQGAYAPPCRPDRRSKLYFKDGTPEDWRACLQKIAAEDFLSPVIAGLGFRDVFSFVGERIGRDYWPDRGRRIERAFAEAYAHYVATDAKPSSDGGLSAPFTSLSLGEDWTPILLLNATSVESGKRFVFSSLAPAATEGGRWLQDAYDFHETLPGQDISLVAAAHDSARFPVISPAGALRADNEIKTKLVDGGYFENYGASTAYDLVLALKGVGLDPFVLLIANNPKLQDSAGWASGAGDGRPLLQPVKPSLIPPLIAAPIGATLATGEARGELALTEMQRRLSNPATGGRANGRSCLAATHADAAPCFAFVSVRKPEAGAARSDRSLKDRIEGVSMSWWLSKPVQKYLDNQLELPRATDAGESAQRALSSAGQNANLVALRRVCDALAAGATSERCRATLEKLKHESD